MLDRLRAALAPGIAVERELARGGMGIVFLGRDVVLERPVAIKVLMPELANAASAERFLREARHAAGLRHPNVVRVHHADEADGLLYYTMDYITGPTLAARLGDGPLPLHEVVRLGLDLLAALDAAHRRKLIHRDVKPSNIFLMPGRALLGDFGIAYALDTTGTALTRTGQPVGTLAYISPEQLHNRPVTERTDVYAVGLVLHEAATGRRWLPLSDPSRGDWSLVPRQLRAPLRRALRVEEADRWPSAGAFASALASAEPRRSVRLAAGGVAVAAALAVTIYASRGRADPQPVMDRDVAVFPFTAVGVTDSSLGLRITGRTGWSLEQVQGLTLTPRQIALRAWRGSSLPPAQRAAALTGPRTRSRFGTWGIVRPRGDSLEVQLRIVSATGETTFEGTILGPAEDPGALGDSLAGVITRAVLSSPEPGKARAEILASTHPEAVAEFLLGEEAFAQDAWLTAERHYLRAFELDSTFVLAGWRLGNARRWLPLREQPPYPPRLFELYRRNRDRVPPVERYLIEAQFEPSGQSRLRRYEQAIALADDDPYAPLLYGDELMHRGPLAGRSLREAVRMLEAAVTLDSTLAPAWEHLAWALIRIGDRERAGAAVRQLERWSAHQEDLGLHVPTFIRMAHEFRFGDAAAREAVAAPLSRSLDALSLVARGALSFDLPDAQAGLGAALAAAGEAAPAQRASGFVARGVALIAMGRPAAGLAALDSAVAWFPNPREARFQAAEWRVVPPALGAPGWTEVERERGRSVLRAMREEPTFRSRASWALALDAYARGDSSQGRLLGNSIGSGGAQSGLASMHAGLTHASRAQWREALAASEPALAFDSAGHGSDPFLRAALHLQRGEWLERLGLSAEADRSWLWYENVDLQGWPQAEAQPAEVDWALGTHARSLRATLALRRGDLGEGCPLARRVAEVWAGAEEDVAARALELADAARACPP